jgi:DNA-directed RNA polymerase specialized sigma24 family protein
MPDERADQVSPATDSHVEARFATGDVAAFEALFRAWQAEVFRWVARIVRDRAAADVLGISVAAVKVRVFRAVRALRRDLERVGVRP